MSADNFIRIFQDEDGKFRGYMGSPSNEMPDEQLRKRRPVFVANSREQACEFAEDEAVLEYGYHFA